MRQRTLQKKFLTLRTTVLFVALIFFFLSSIYYSFNLYGVKNISIRSESKNQIKNIKGLDLTNNQNLFLLDINKLKLMLLELNPIISDLSIHKRFPSTLEISYKIKEPIAYMKSNDGYFYLADDGRILDKKKENIFNDSLTEILYYQTFDYATNSIGSTIDFTDIKYSLKFLSKLRGFDYVVDSIDINNPNMIRLNLNSSTVIFTIEKDINGQINNLDNIIRQFKVEGKSFSLLDLRFDKPILKLN